MKKKGEFKNIDFVSTAADGAGPTSSEKPGGGDRAASGGGAPEEKRGGGRERRRYPRVQVRGGSDALSVEIVGFGAATVFDMSLNGAALGQPVERPVVNEGEVVTLHLQHGDPAVDCKILCKVVRTRQTGLALEFVDVPIDARILIDRLISDRVIGLNMNLVDPRYYSEGSSFTHWFHGPKDTNLFLWEGSEGVVSKAQFDLHNAVLVFENDAFIFEKKTIDVAVPPLRPQQVLQKAHSILSQMHTNLKSLGAFRGLVEKQIGG